MEVLKKKSEVKISKLREAISEQTQLSKKNEEKSTGYFDEAEEKLLNKLTKIKLEVLDIDFTVKEFLLYVTK